MVWAMAVRLRQPGCPRPTSWFSPTQAPLPPCGGGGREGDVGPGKRGEGGMERERERGRGGGRERGRGG